MSSDEEMEMPVVKTRVPGRVPPRPPPQTSGPPVPSTGPPVPVPRRPTGGKLVPPFVNKQPSYPSSVTERKGTPARVPTGNVSSLANKMTSPRGVSITPADNEVCEMVL